MISMGSVPIFEAATGSEAKCTLESSSMRAELTVPPDITEDTACGKPAAENSYSFGSGGTERCDGGAMLRLGTLEPSDILTSPREERAREDAMLLDLAVVIFRLLAGREEERLGAIREICLLLKKRF